MIMNLDHILSSLIYLAACFVVFVAGHLVFILFRRSYNIQDELVEKDNAAFALVLCGYYLGLTFSIGGVIAGPSAGMESDLIDILVYGPLAILLLNLSALINDRFILSEFDIRKEILQDQNCGTGVVEFAVFVATGLNIFGALYGQGGLFSRPSPSGLWARPFSFSSANIITSSRNTIFTSRLKKITLPWASALPEP